MRPLLSLFLWSVLSIAAWAQAASPTLALGATAPDFDLPGVDGQRWSLKDFAGAKALVVAFTCVHCPTAQAYEERLKQITADYRDRGVAVVAISPNDPKSLRLDELGYSDLSDSLEEMQVRARDAAFNFLFLYDGDIQAVSRGYGPLTTPHVFVFDAERKLRYAGRIDDAERIADVKRSDLRLAIDAVLAGRAPEVAQTKVFGCSVKWAGKSDQVDKYMQKLAQEPVMVEEAGEEVLRTLRKGDGKNYRLVNFWATWCGPCVTEFPALVEISRMYRRRNFEFVSVSVNHPDEKPAVLEFLQKMQASNRNLLFASADRFGLLAAFEPAMNGQLPATYLLGPGGEIIYQHVGEIDPLLLKKQIVQALGRTK